MTEHHHNPADTDTGSPQKAPGPDSRNRYAPSSRAADLALLAAGIETGWWDDEGRPAPWPEDFFHADGTINPDWQPGPTGPMSPAEPGEPPF